MKKVLLLTAVVLAAIPAIAAEPRHSVSEKIEWTYTDRPETPNSTLPNVLLIGDSITRAYYTAAAAELAGKANCYYFATSASVGDERLGPQLAEYFKMIAVRFDAVHFNNGMHGWGYAEDEYKRYFPELLAAIRAGAPHARLVWATITPVRKDKPGGATNSRIDERNAIANELVAKQSIPVDDQHALMLAHQDLHSDDVHFTPEGSALEGKQVATSVAKLLPVPTAR